MKVLLADPHPEVQSALHLILNRIPGVTEVVVAGSLVQLLAECAQTCPDLILFDLALVQPARARSQSLADFVSVLRRLCPGGRVVVMSSRLDAQAEALAAGATGFVSKTDPPDEFFSSLVRFLENRA
jgi:DNA-binding NarL/FixJ family response regulator